MTLERSEVDELFRAAERGDTAARQRLLAEHRPRLRRMVAARLDRRLAARVDPSDVVQEALADAAQNMDRYFRDKPLPFYPWLRQFASQRLVRSHRHHVRVRSRSVERETAVRFTLPDESADALANLLLASGTSPSRGVMRDELRVRVRAALDRLPPRDREVLVMRHLEDMSAAEIGAALGVSEGAVWTRHVRALARLRGLLDGEASESWR
jgi:RNA polymerase sigma-70 factor (ECF subfamily)